MNWLGERCGATTYYDIWDQLGIRAEKNAIVSIRRLWECPLSQPYLQDKITVTRFVTSLVISQLQCHLAFRQNAASMGSERARMVL